MATTATGAQQFVFGYGSLIVHGGHRFSRSPAPEGFVTDLHEHARAWGVAMDNEAEVPGYKLYRSPDGSRPAVFVTFLEVAESPGSLVNGVCRPVSSTELAALDLRERNYVRTEVTELVDNAPGPTWTYVGSPAGRARSARGRALGRAVIDRGYRDAVLRGYDSLGPGELETFRRSTGGASLPVMNLERVDIPN